MNKNGKYLALLTRIFQKAEQEGLGLRRGGQSNESRPYERARVQHSTVPVQHPLGLL
ncbi:hypothetical protein HOY80DRAFT_950090 [Tuber brumale]|nr:hypothetical protein HOY80DRAFT_950090 [Tuber brumale]